MRAIRCENWRPNEYSRICQLHFILGKSSPFPNNPLPSKFSFGDATTGREIDTVDRYERLQARRRQLAQSQPELTEDEVAVETTPSLSEVLHELPDHVVDLNYDKGHSLEFEPLEQELRTKLLCREEDLRNTNAVLEEVKEKLHHVEEESLQKSEEEILYRCDNYIKPQVLP